MTALVAEHFAHVSSAPNGISMLRELILKLAVQGRLTGSEFRSASGGHFQSGWRFLRLPDAATYRIGKTPPSKEARHWDAAGIPWVSISDMSHFETVTETSRRVSREFASETFKYEPVPAGSLLMSFKLTVGKVAVLGVAAYHNEAIISMQPKEGLSRDYLMRVLPAIAQSGRTKDALMGATLNSSSLAELVIPAPSIEEQHRIVAKVDELMALCDRLEARQQDAEAAHARLVQALLDSLTQARDADEFQACWQRLATEFQTLFSSEASVDLLGNAILTLAVSGRLSSQQPGDESAEQLLRKIDDDARDFCTQQKAPRSQVLPVSGDDAPFPAPGGWVWARLGSLFRVITDGDHQAPPQTAQGVAFLTIGNLTKGYLDFEQARSVEPSYFTALAPYRKPAVGDLLYTVVGATYGRPVLVETDRPFCVQRHVAILKRSDFLCAKFALYLLKSPLVYDQASANTTGTAQPTIPLKPLRNLLVPLPPLDEQRRIVAKVTELLALCDQLKARIAAARAKHAQLAEALVAQAVA
jgi:type I restriction enzyme S subunit